MDKNLIHIDDYMRQRLSGGEEPERPGAWLAMRELLDKEMPTVAVGYNWRRFFGYVTALVLLTSASVGGYMYMNHASQQKAEFAGRVGGNSATNRPANQGIKGNGVNATLVNHNEDVAPSLANESKSAKPKTGAVNATAGHISSSVTLVSNTPSNSVAIPKKGNRTLIASSRVYASAGRLKSVGTSKAIIGRKDVDGRVAASAASRLAAASAAEVAKGKADQPKNPIAPTTSFSKIGSAKSSARLASNSARVFSATADGAKMAKDPVVKPSALRLVHDTIARLRVNARRVLDANTQKMKYRIDTVPMSQLIVARFIPEQSLNENSRKSAVTNQNPSAKISNARRTLNNPSLASNTQASARNKNAISSSEKIIPNASLAEKTDAESKATNLASSKSSNFHLHLWDADKVNAAIDKIKFNLASIQLYPGLMMGINGSFFTPNSLGGFQFGLTSLIAINEWWSVLTELKYLYQFNTGSTVRDNYMNVTDGTISPAEYKGKIYDYYSWTEEHVDHYFNYEVVQSFQLPIALRYCWGRFFAQGGLNLVYNSPIKAKEVTQFQNDQTVRAELRPVQAVKEPFVTNDHPTVQISDFGSRFGTGYILGAGFSFTPNVYLDFRATQTFWDNAKTDGAKQISKNLFKTPSIQLSVGYRLSGKK
ncbi:MAG: hypothetical protein ABI378_07890 [Chitinophagaceae bacterium]